MSCVFTGGHTLVYLLLKSCHLGLHPLKLIKKNHHIGVLQLCPHTLSRCAITRWVGWMASSGRKFNKVCSCTIGKPSLQEPRVRHIRRTIPHALTLITPIVKHSKESLSCAASVGIPEANYSSTVAGDMANTEKSSKSTHQTTRRATKQAQRCNTNAKLNLMENLTQEEVSWKAAARASGRLARKNHAK